MTETVVQVSTLEQWKAVLDVWFKQGYEWCAGGKEYHEGYFKGGSRELLLDKDNYILVPDPGKREPISYKEFMAQQKEGNKMETYYVTQEKLYLITELKKLSYPVYELTRLGRYEDVGLGFDSTQEKALLRYLGGDETIEFKVKESLYRLWRIDSDGDNVYMSFNSFGTPSWVMTKKDAFTAPLQEIKKWKTPAWEIEEVH